jgi:hypothetical protein
MFGQSTRPLSAPRRVYSIVGLAALIFMGPAVLVAHAANLPQPSVAYGAEGSMEFDNMQVPYKVWQDGDKTRREMTMQGQLQIMILRRDLGRMYMLMPAQAMAMEMALDPKMASPQEMMKNIEATAQGTETVAGHNATRYRMAGKDVLGYAMEGTAWVTDQGIMLRMHSTSVVDGKPKEVLVEITKVKVGPVDPGMFEVPAGTKLMKMN